MLMLSEEIDVDTGAPTEILRFNMGDLHNVIISATAAVRIGTASVSSSKGYSLSAGSAIGYNALDFQSGANDEVIMYAATAVNTTVNVMGFFVR